MSEIKANRTRNLRYKRPALASMGFDAMIAELEEIEEACDSIRWYVDQDDDSLINALDGDEEDYVSMTRYDEELAGEVHVRSIELSAVVDDADLR